MPYNVPEDALIYGTGYEATDVVIEAGEHADLTPELQRLLDLNLATISTPAPITSSKE
jgi:hypothetical protein